MDTWATSSLTPQIACGWERDPELFGLTFPMDLNTHVNEIIRCRSPAWCGLTSRTIPFRGCVR